MPSINWRALGAPRRVQYCCSTATCHQYPEVPMPDRALLVELGIDAMDGAILDQMKIMKRVRESGSYDNIACVIRGFDDDRRELYEVPEVQAFCRRLTSLGFN